MTDFHASNSSRQLYRRDEKRLRYISSIAQHIVTDIAPESVLDVGCMVGLLVEALRERDVEAFGVDVSEYAVQNVHPAIHDYCWVGNVTDPFPQKYGLILCIEVLEHLPRQQAQQAVENLCRHSDDVLFSSTPLDYKEPTHCNVNPPEYWAELFARNGFFRDVDFDASFINPWAARFRRATGPISRIAAAYERRLWLLEQENQARRGLSIQQRDELSAQATEIQALRIQVRQWTELQESAGWALLQRLQHWRARVAPPDSVRDQALDDVLRAVRLRKPALLFAAMRPLRREVMWQAKVLLWKARLRVPLPLRGRIIQVDEVPSRPALEAHHAAVDIIICVHNALQDLQRCLASVLQHTGQPYSLIVVDDGSDLPTRDYLAEFARTEGAALLRNEQAQGYTRAANQGLRRSSADYVVLLNSDTVVTAGWLDRLVSCAESDPRTGLVGPLSNTASWQSIPEIEALGDWASNPLPAGMTIEEVGRLVALYSGRLYPTVPFLNGFCLLIRREVIREIGYFDEENFGAGYGEENDFELRARKAGWQLAVADDTYIYHAQSRSYSQEKRKLLSDRAGVALAGKYGQGIIREGVSICQQDRVLEGIRARSRAMFARQEWVRQGHAKFAGRRVLFVLPIFQPGGGGNVVISEAMAMREMGVDVGLFNLTAHRPKFEQAYPMLRLPVAYGRRDELPSLAEEYDAVIATFNISVEWLAQIDRLVRGYYIQDFEPYLYPEGTEEFRRAMASYTLFPDLVRFTKTEWNRQEAKKQIGVESKTVGASVDIDLFRPRPLSKRKWPDRPIRIAAMVRVSSAYREPKLTMELLQKATEHYGLGVEVVIFGTNVDDPRFAKLPRDFAWTLAGILNPRQMANLLNEVDIFADFSSHQAMGLTALEAMACGAAVIVPARGGAGSFAQHQENSLIVDTTSQEECWRALQRLIEDDDLRLHIHRKALIDACNFFPERPAFNILQALFEPGNRAV